MSTKAQEAVEADDVNKKLAEKVGHIVEKLKKAPEGKTAQFQADTQLVQGLLTKARVRQFELDIDESPRLGGTDKGPNPVELVLVSLGTCQEIVYALYAAVLGIALDEVKIKVKGQLDGRGLFDVAPVPAGFIDIDYEVEIKSPAPPEKIKQLVDIVNAHCPVLDTLRRPINVKYSARLNGDSL